MPNRIIREAILTSERIDKLDAVSEVFYRRLMSKVDDHGLYDARPAILRSSLYPLRVDRVREADISRSLAACQSAGLIALYQHDGKPYLQMLDTRWQARSEPKYPLPSEENRVPMKTAANNCAQVQTTAPVFVVEVGVVDEKHPPPPRGGGFAEFWSLWPAHKRKVGKDQCLRKWESKGCAEIADAVMQSLRQNIASEDWKKNNGEFIPAPLVWLNQARWEAPIETAASVTVPGESTQDWLARMAAERAAEDARLAGSKGPPPSLMAIARRRAQVQAVEGQ